jgi:hypothetical protein
LLALPAAQETALQIRKNGLEILVCTAEEFNEKGLPETYEAEEYFTDGLQFSAQEQALEETNTSTKPYDEG